MLKTTTNSSSRVAQRDYRVWQGKDRTRELPRTCERVIAGPRDAAAGGHAPFIHTEDTLISTRCGRFFQSSTAYLGLCISGTK